MNININNNIKTKNQNHNIININNINSDTNILNVKKNSINKCKEQKEYLDLINQNKNINNSNLYNKGMNQYSKIKENELVQTMKNELSEKNKNFKNIKFITSAINRNINNSKANLMNFPSYIQKTVNDINNNNKNMKVDNNTKSHKNILYKGNISEANRNIKNMILNNSSQYLFNYKNLETDSDYVNSRKPKINSNVFRDFVISSKNNLNNNYESKNSFDKKLRNARNSNFSKDNITLYKPIKSPTLENNINLINFKEKIKNPLTPNLTQVHSKKGKAIKKNSGIYVKPLAISSKSKSKPIKVKKTKSVL